MPVYLALIVVLSAALQGLFGYVVYPVAAILLLVPAAFLKPRKGLGAASLVLAGLAAWTIASSVINGFSAESLTAATLPLALLAVTFLVDCLDDANRVSTLISACFLSALMAAVGIASLVGYDPLGWHVGSHLVFGFSNCDVAALWFASCVLVGQLLVGRNRFLALALPLNMTGLLLCCSPLVTVLFIAAEVVVAVRNRDDALQMSQLASVVISALIAVGLYLAQDAIIMAIVFIILLLVWAWFAEPAGTALAKGRGALIVLGAGGIAGVVGCFFSQRLLVEMPQQLLFAFQQMGDGIACILANPLLGLGTCQWNYLCVYYQSSAYSGMYVPDSLIHVGAETGLPGLLLAIALVVLLVRAVWGKGDLPRIIAVLVLVVSLLTSALVSNMAVASLAFLLVMALESLERLNREEDTRPQWKRALDDPAPEPREPFALSLPRPLWVVLMALLAVGCLVCCSLQYQQIVFRSHWVSGEVDSADVCTEFASEPYWVQNSPGARIIYDQYYIGEVTSSDNIYQSYAVGEEGLGILATTTQENLYDVAAKAYTYGWRFEFDEGFQLLLDAAKKAPNAVSIYATMQTYLDYTNVSDELAQEAIDLAAQHGYTLVHQELSEDEVQQFEEAAEEYRDSLPGVYGEDESD